MLDLSLFHIVHKAVHLEDFVSLQNQVLTLRLDEAMLADAQETKTISVTHLSIFRGSSPS